MNQEIERVKTDLAIMQKALGLAPSFRRDWIQWMRRDKWLNLWWCLPGLIIFLSALLPFDRKQTFFGLVTDQWAGILVAGSLVWIAVGHTRQLKGRDGRPDSLIRESMRRYGLSGQGLAFSLAFGVEFLAFLLWGKQHHVAFQPFWTGLFLLWGATCLVGALVAKAWVLLGFAIPFMTYALCLPLAGDHHAAQGILFGTMFIAVALLFTAIQAWEIRKIEQHDEPDQLQRA